MNRLFEQHLIRKSRELDGLWNFTRKDNNKAYLIPVPGCIEQHPDMLNYRGQSTYQKQITLLNDTNIRMMFEGVSHTADVFFDEVKVAHHYNAFTGFAFTLKNVKAGTHSLRVEVDNSFSEASALHVPNDYYTYGGITRPVILEEIPSVYIKDIHFTPHMKENKATWNTDIVVFIENISSDDFDGKLMISLANVEKTEEVSLKGNEIIKISLSLDFENITCWDELKPFLYSINATLYNEASIATDDYMDRVGFREIKIEGQKILLNGRRIFLKGFNRHEDYGTLGCAIPVQVMAQDVDMILETGANAIRTCHYPNDKRFLDLCDEKGILIWEENHARGFDLKKMQNPNFDKQCEDCINEMIRDHFNHPSIIIWGILNECASETKEGREKYARQYTQIRSLDPSRPVTSATCRHFTDICLDIPDIVSFNIYSGWYEDCPVKERHEKQMDWIKEAAKKDTPVIVSEFGGAAIYGYRDRARVKWSEERQSDIIKDHLNIYKEDDRISGAFIWQYADCKVTEEEWWTTRARCHNNKGVVDEYRRPKEAYDTISEIFKTITRN